MDEGNLGGKLCIMARAHYIESQSALSRNRCDNERSYDTSKTDRQINKGKIGGCRKGRQQHTRTVKKNHDIYVRIEQVRDTIYTNQTGKFTITSSRGHKYIIIFCAIDGNVVLAEPMKNKSEESMVETYQKLIKRLNDAGIFPKKHILDT